MNGWPAHAIGGAVICLILCFKSPWWWPVGMSFVLTGGAYLREKWQHHWEPLNKHQWIEALTWGAGGLAATGGFFLVSALL